MPSGAIFVYPIAWESSPPFTPDEATRKVLAMVAGVAPPQNEEVWTDQKGKTW